jgi:hypothetical protein
LHFLCIVFGLLWLFIFISSFCLFVVFTQRLYLVFYSHLSLSYPFVFSSFSLRVCIGSSIVIYLYLVLLPFRLFHSAFVLGLLLSFIFVLSFCLFVIFTRRLYTQAPKCDCLLSHSMKLELLGPTPDPHRHPNPKPNANPYHNSKPIPTLTLILTLTLTLSLPNPSPSLNPNPALTLTLTQP